MGAPNQPLKKPVEQPKPDRTGTLPRSLKIEITGGYGSGAEKMARRIAEMLKKDLIYSNRVTVRLELPPDGTEMDLEVPVQNPDGSTTMATRPSKFTEGPEDATFLLVVRNGLPVLDQADHDQLNQSEDKRITELVRNSDHPFAALIRERFPERFP
jgi:hypothetical protein